MELTGRRFVATAWYRRGLALALVAAGLLVGVVGALLSPSLYTAESLLLVRPGAADAASSNISGPAPITPESAAARAVETDRQIVASEPVLRAGLARAGVRPEGIDAALRRLRQRLTVEVPADSNIIRVAVDDPDRARAVTLADAIVESYLAQRSGVFADTAAALQLRERGRYDVELRRIDARIADVRRAAHVLDIGQDVTLAGARLDELASRTSQARERLTAVEAQASSGRGMLARVPGRVLDSSESSNARANDESRNALARLEQERQHVSEQYAADWPGLADLDARIAVARRQVAENAQVRSVNRREIRNPVADQLRQNEASLAMERQGLAQQIAELSRQEDAARARVAQLREVDATLRDLQRERDTVEAITRQLTISQASQELRNEIVGDTAATVRVLQPATASDRPRVRWPLLLIAGLLLGLAAAAAAIVIATWRRRTFLLPDEAGRSTGLPLLATLPMAFADLRSAAGRASVVPLATAVDDLNVDQRSIRSLAVLGDPADAARVALGLGQTMAERMGRRTIIVDLSSSGSLRAVRTAHDAASHDAVHVRQGPVERLGLIEDGGDAALRDGRHGRERLARLFAHAATEDAFIIVVGHDTPDQVALARRVHPLVDASLIVVRARATSCSDVVERRDAVLTAGGDLIGIVFVGRPITLPESVQRWI